MQLGLARTRLVAAAVALLAVAPAASARAAVLEADRAVERACHAQRLAGAAGTDSASYTAPLGGWLTARLDGGPAGDWDLALFDAGSGALLGASAAAGSDELATVPVGGGQTVIVQACRLDGARGSAPLALAFRPASPAPDDGPASLLRVRIAGPDDAARLGQLGFDLTEHGGPRFIEVVTYSDAERRRLRRLGYGYDVRIRDLDADLLRTSREDAAYARRVAASPLPSGRTAYRQAADYQAELKQLADDHPGLVRHLELPLRSIENRPIEGVEIASGVHRTDDGRPVYVVMGLHHAREWPSGELAIEFALDLAAGYGTNARITALLDSVRVYVIPVVNPDGFAVSRGAGPSAADDDADATLALSLADEGAYKRKNCRAVPPESETVPCPERSGVDLNRNYGAYWGGAGSSSDRTSQAYRGAGPYSEPESEAVHRFSSGLQIVTLITNHTFTDDGKWLRQPGFNVAGDEVPPTVPDEARMKALGDAMAAATGYTSELGYETLGNITGATEDWNYFAQGTFGYTPELRGSNFHMNYEDGVVGEYLGEGQFAGRGVRDALLIAGEQAADTRDHSVIQGGAPAGRTLRIRKEFVTVTSQQGLVVNDRLESTLTVPADGTYEWHVNPSTRPLVRAQGVQEAWTLTCEDGAGTVLETREVVVDRGQRVTLDLACAGPGAQAAGGDGGGQQPAGPTSTDGATDQGTATGAAGGIAIGRIVLSARRLNATGRLRVALSPVNGPLENVRVTLRDRRGRVLATARLRRLARRTTVVLRLRRRVAPGRQRLEIRGVDAGGRTVRASRTIRLRR